MINVRKRVLSLIISLAICIITVAAAAPAKEVSAAEKYIKVDAFIKYTIEKLRLPVDNNSKTPYIDAAIKAGIVKEGDFKKYTSYLTRTDCAVIANRVDKYLYGEYFGYRKEVYEFLKGCNYNKGKLYYNVKGELYPEGMNSVTYSAEQFLNDVVKPRISDFKFNKELAAWYYNVFDSEGNSLEEYIEIGTVISSGAFVGPFEDNDYLVMAWQKIVDEERKFDAVYNKRISDIGKIAQSKRRDVAEIMAKGIIKGYSNGKYIQNRSFKGSSKITVSGAKNVIELAINKDARAPISPDGQLIRTTNLPKNASEYPYILECFPNDFYEMVYSFQRYSRFKNGTMNRDEYRYPNETGNNHVITEYASRIRVNVKPYEYYDIILDKAGRFLQLIFNIDYNTISSSWSDDLIKTYTPIDGVSFTEQVDKYVYGLKKNHVQVESSLISLEPSTLYEFEGDLYIRAYVKYRIKAETLNVDYDNELIFGNIASTYLINLQNNKWTYGYYDIKILASSVRDIYYYDFGVAPDAGITDGPLKGSK